MSINRGDISGCLEVIGDSSELGDDIQKIARMMAEREWNSILEGRKWYHSENFKTYYNLNKSESEDYDNHLAMPETFISKYIKKDGYSYELSMIPKLLYHKKKPNTFRDLKKAFSNKDLYKVKCRICNRSFLIDEHSFKCVKWRSCSGAECLKYTVNDTKPDYSVSYYDWNNEEHLLQTLNTQLTKVDELTNPLTYYSADEALKIAYISDIHLMHHLKYYNGNGGRMIRRIVDNLYATMSSASTIIFDGDISSDTEMTLKFYSYFMKKYDYLNFSEFKKKLIDYKRIKTRIDSITESQFIKRCGRISKHIENMKTRLAPIFDYDVFDKYRRVYRPHDTLEDAFECFKQVSSFKNLKISKNKVPIIKSCVCEIARTIKIFEKYQSEYERFEWRKDCIQSEIKSFEEEYSKSIVDIQLSDYHHVTMQGVYVVLGNHEYIEFPNVNSCVSFYKKELEKIGITLLHNSYSIGKKYLIFGGTGFAKYDNKWNADSIICCPGFTREDEAKETEAFELAYKNALNYAKEHNLCFLCASHYPISACKNGEVDKEAIYFTGHNHQNKYIKTAEQVVYSDNQIGYKDNNIQFRIATTGLEVNPYCDLNDGLYKTSISDYLQFYRYIGENIGEGNLLYQRCQNGKAQLYVIKRKGYYGFFIMNPKGCSKGISIVNGGNTKKLTNSTDMRWICDNFDIVLLKYMQLLLPLRTVQEQLSKELQDLGLSGTIHGCIVDIDFFHHIMLNPAEGSLTFYYSGEFGLMEKMESFSEIIKSLQNHSQENVFFSYDIKNIKEQYNLKSKKKGYMLGVKTNQYLLETDKSEIMDTQIRGEQVISRRTGMYGVSRKVNSLQRLFSGHVLRDFDLRLTETKQNAYRKYLFIDRLFVYDGIPYMVIEDDGTDIIIAEEIEDTVNGDWILLASNLTELVLTGNTRKIAISTLKSKVANVRERETYWITTTTTYYDNEMKHLSAQECVFNQNDIGKGVIQEGERNAVLAAYRSDDDIDVKFDDGYLAEHVHLKRWKNGKIIHPEVQAELDAIKEQKREKNKVDRANKYIGMTRTMKCGMDATIIAYEGCKELTIRFADGLIRRHIRSDKFMNGNVAHK